MPLSFHVDDAAQLVVTTAVGEVEAEDLLEHARKLVEVGERPARELVDFSEPAALNVTMASVREMAEYLRDHDANPPGSRLALVGGTDAIFGTLRVFAAHREHENVDIRVFRDTEDARGWLTEGT